MIIKDHASRGASIPIQTQYKIAVQILDALFAVHTEKALLIDLSPEKILVKNFELQICKQAEESFQPFIHPRMIMVIINSNIYSLSLLLRSEIGGFNEVVFSYDKDIEDVRHIKQGGLRGRSTHFHPANDTCSRLNFTSFLLVCLHTQIASGKV